MYLLKLILSYFKLTRIVPFKVRNDENLVRAILHPLMYSNSKNKLKREAVLPPPERNDVSIMRLDYSNDDKCKLQGQSLNVNGQIYIGLAIFKNEHVCDTNSLPDTINIEVVATPLNTKGKIINNKSVFIIDSGLPFHADIIYERPVLKGEPNPHHIKLASDLIKKLTFFKDKNPQSGRWEGDPLSCTNKSNEY